MEPKKREEITDFILKQPTHERFDKNLYSESSESNPQSKWEYPFRLIQKLGFGRFIKK